MNPLALNDENLSHLLIFRGLETAIWKWVKIMTREAADFGSPVNSLHVSALAGG